MFVSALQINLDFDRGSNGKGVVSKYISEFARPVFLRPVFRPTPYFVPVFKYCYSDSRNL